MRLIATLLLVVVVLGQSNLPFDTVTGSPTLVGASTPTIAVQAVTVPTSTQGTTASVNTTTASASGAPPQSADMFSLQNFGSALNFGTFNQAQTLTSPQPEGGASLPLAPPATSVNTSDPIQVALYLQSNIANDLRSDFTQFDNVPTQTNCCASFTPIHILSEDF